CIEQRPVRMACYIGEVKSIPYGLSASYCGSSPGHEDSFAGSCAPGIYKGHMRHTIIGSLK
ncbi:MAG: hypothetical protein KAI77_06955, partial [Gammaproteobacteria bacterium]|nr:hypothetical protein [Gammaproteobacteria bacterium]